MKLYLFISMVCLSPIWAYSQSEVGHFVTVQGEMIKIYENEKQKTQAYKNYRITGDIGFSGELFFYYDAQQEFKKIKQKKIEEVHFGSKLYRNFPITRTGAKRLHEVIMENDTYVLTSYYFLVNYFYIFSKSDGKMVESKTKHSKKKKKDYTSLEKKVSKYFPDCNEALAIVKSNIKNGDYRILYGSIAYADIKMFKGISNYKCK
ncbi:MAG: hypothetical protein Aureis2KO_01550 [Aureisphaera sp.]